MSGFKKHIQVDTHDVDFNGICRASSLMKYIQSAADMQLTESGMSYDKLKDQNRAFIISKIKLEFTEAAYAYDELVAETFPAFSRGYSFIRCYALYRGEKMIGRAISIWALIDTESRKLIKVNDFDLGLTLYEPWDMALTYSKLPDGMEKVGCYTVCYSDIDRNMHINNTKYADIFANFLPLKGKRIDEITISYVNEAKYRDVLDVFIANDNDTYYLKTVGADGKVNAEAQIHLTDI